MTNEEILEWWYYLDNDDKTHLWYEYSGDDYDKVFMYDPEVDCLDDDIIINIWNNYQSSIKQNGL
jgi:hypothetical protein